MNDSSVAMLALSARTTNALQKAGIYTIEDLVKLKVDELYNIKNLGVKSVNEILDVILKLEKGEITIKPLVDGEIEEDSSLPICDGDYLIAFAHNIKWLSLENISYINNNLPIHEMGLTVRAINALKNNNCHTLYDISSLKMKQLLSFRKLGKKTIDEILERLRYYTRVITTEERELQKPHIAYIVNQFSTEEFTYEIGMIKSNIVKVLTLEENKSNVEALEKEPKKHCQEFISLLMSDGYFISLFRNHTYDKIKMLGRASAQDLSCIFPGELVNYMPEILKILIDEKLVECIDEKYELVHPTFKEYLDTLDCNSRNNEFLKLKASGETFEQIGHKNGLSGERVRQIIMKALKAMPTVKEDKYLYLFEKYRINKDMVINLLNLDPCSYEYFSMKTKNLGNLDYAEMLNEENLPISIKKNIEAHKYRNCIDIDGEKIEKRRNPILQHILKTKCRDEVTLQEVKELYYEVIAAYNLENYESCKYPKTYFEGSMAIRKDVLWKYGKKLRYYYITDDDLMDLLNEIGFYDFKDVEISARYFTNNYPEVMQLYDIRDEYELHNLLNKRRNLFKNLDVTFNRMPNIGFGNFDRDKQVLDLLLENAPIKTEELSLLFEHKYGMKDASSIYFGCIRKYVDNGIYNIDFKDVTPEEECALREILNCDVVPLDRVKDEFAAKFPNEDLEKINNYNLRKFGYRISYNLVYNNEYGSLELLIKNNILSQDTIDLSTDHLLFRHDAMYRSLLAHKRAYEIVEFARRKFINIKKLETFGISKEMLHDFAQSARACANSRYFTLYNLKQRGFCHELFEFGFEDYFYESVLRYSPLFKFFSCGRGSSCIFTESNDLTVDDMLKMILMDKGSMHIQDMIDYLEQEYGVSFEKNTLRKRLRHSTLYYSDATEKIYYDDFSGEI